MTLLRKLRKLENLAEAGAELPPLNPQQVTRGLLAFTAWAHLHRAEMLRLKIAQPKLDARQAGEWACAGVPSVTELIRHCADTDLLALIGCASRMQFQAELQRQMKAQPDYLPTLQRAHAREVARLPAAEQRRLLLEGNRLLYELAGE